MGILSRQIWNTIKTQHAWSGVCLWIHAYRDWKADRLRRERRRTDGTRIRKIFRETVPEYHHHESFSALAALQQQQMNGLHNQYHNYAQNYAQSMASQMGMTPNIQDLLNVGPGSIIRLQ